MVVKGIAKGKTIELAEPLPFKDGQEVTLDVTSSSHPARSASPAEISAALKRLPSITKEDTDAMEAAINSGQRPAASEGVFDNEPAA